MIQGGGDLEIVKESSTKTRIEDLVKQQEDTNMTKGEGNGKKIEVM